MRGLTGGVGFRTTELIVARPIGQTPSAFIYWLFNSTAFRKLGEGAMYGAGGQKRVPDDFVRDFPLALPPAPEQIAIAAFLDRETGKIDALVEEQRRLIELLKEKRQAVISHAVTKGLDPSAPMKDSGVEWLGEVPAHWEVKQLKRVATVLPGFAFSANGFSNDPGHTRLLRGVNIAVGSIRWDDNIYWDRGTDDGLDKFELRPGDLVLGVCFFSGSPQSNLGRKTAVVFCACS
jgi:type I restriction enzyme S subunit